MITRKRGRILHSRVKVRARALVQLPRRKIGRVRGLQDSISIICSELTLGNNSKILLPH